MPPLAASPRATASAPAYCPKCGAALAPDHAFCGGCGRPTGPASVPAMPGEEAKRQTLFFGAMQAARAKLVLIRGDGLDGVSYTLAGQEHVAGRVDAPLLFAEDPYLSPQHANFFYRQTKLVVRDQGSANGVYWRIRGTVEIADRGRLLIGEQVIEAQRAIPQAEEMKPTGDGTYFFASPRRPAGFRVVQLLRGGGTGLAYRAQSDVVSMGREGNDINFGDDPFISGRHAQVALTGGKLMLRDLDSKNGTFIQVTEQELGHGDYVFLGQQLLRVEIV
jgi:pSer/pThr/pTyr-binding forkhead associated (FHA) protein